MNTWFVIALVLASFAGSALMIWAFQSAQKWQANLQALAQRHGWHYDRQRSGGSTRTMLSDPDAGWVLTLYSYSSGNTSGSTSSSRRYTMFEAADLSADGFAVLGPDIPEKTKMMANLMMEKMGTSDLGVWLLNKVAGNLGADIQGLRSIEGPGPGTLMTTPGSEETLDALRYAPELNNARAGKNEAQQPIVMRGSFGLRVRQAGLLRKPDQIEDFIRLGRALAGNLRGS